MVLDATEADHNADARRLAIRVIGTLVNSKKIAAQKILAPAGIPEELLRQFIHGHNPITKQRLSKREAAVIILDELARTPGRDTEVVRNLIALASRWNDFSLAMDEYEARGVVQKAREMEGLLDQQEERERAALEARTQESARRKQREIADSVRQQSPLLLAQFDEATADCDPQRRGYLLEDLFNRLFGLYRLPVQRAFRRNDGAEQIDGAFEMESWHYIVECRWRARLANIRELDGLRGQVSRSGHQTMGLFLSINGWSENVPDLLKQNPDKRIFLMEGVDLRSVLAQQIDLRSLLKGKLSYLNLRGEPYVSASHI